MILQEIILDARMNKQLNADWWVMSGANFVENHAIFLFILVYGMQQNKFSNQPMHAAMCKYKRSILIYFSTMLIPPFHYFIP